MRNLLFALLVTLAIYGKSHPYINLGIAPAYSFLNANAKPIFESPFYLEPYAELGAQKDKWSYYVRWMGNISGGWTNVKTNGNVNDTWYSVSTQRASLFGNSCCIGLRYLILNKPNYKIRLPLSLSYTNTKTEILRTETVYPNQTTYRPYPNRDNSMSKTQSLAIGFGITSEINLYKNLILLHNQVNVYASSSKLDFGLTRTNMEFGLRFLFI